MPSLQATNIQCPYCWEQIEVDVDCSVKHQRYIEDCSVCCRPIVLDVVTARDAVQRIDAKTENE